MAEVRKTDAVSPLPGYEQAPDRMRLTKGNPEVRPSARVQVAYTLAEVVVGMALLGLITISLFAAFSTGAMLVQVSRENLRATEILTQKMELVRLFTWEQIADPSQAAPAFTEWYDPASPDQGVMYAGSFSVTGPAPEVPADYCNNLRVVTVTVCWTNYLHGSRIPIPRSRQMQTCVARYGMQSYFTQ
jgi:hypothetical protein